MRQTLLWASRRRGIETAITRAPLTRALVQRFVAGKTVADAVRVARELTAQGMTVSLDHLGEDTRDARAATAAVAVYRELLERLAGEGLAATVEVSVKLSAIGQALDEAMALDNARAICVAARDAGSSVTIDTEDHTTTDSTLGIVAALRGNFPSTGAVIQASLHRSEQDCTRLACAGSRVRLCKGAYQEPPTVAWQGRDEIRSSYLRCLRALLRGGAYTMVATHDPRLISAAHDMFLALAPWSEHEYQLLYGVRTDEQRRLVDAHEKVRVYVPFGDEWYTYLVRRLAERPANVALVLRALGQRG